MTYYYKQENFGILVLDDLHNQQISQEFCDIQITINNETIKAHQCVLVANSGKLREMIKSTNLNEDGEKRIDLTDLVSSLKTFQHVLYFYYTGTVSHKETDAVSVKEAAEKLDSQRLLNELEQVYLTSIIILIF